MKITTSKEKISPFGGFNFCHELLLSTGLPTIIDNHLGQRVKYFGFNYSDILFNQFAIFLNGGDCAEDIQEHLKDYLNQVPDLSVCSADTILRGVKELATPTEEFISSNEIRHEFNINLNINKLMLKMLIKTNQLDHKTGYTLDYDNQVVPTEKYDSSKTYKKCNGYQPGVATIGKNIVYIEGRNGNSQAKYKQDETLNRCFNSLDEQSINVKRFRADSASYQKKVVELAEMKSENFYIRASRSANFEQQVNQIEKTSWQKIRLGTQEMEVSEIPYAPFDGETSYRLIVSRIKRKDGQTSLFSGDAYTYRAILTNDNNWSAKEIVSFYNQRGNAEQVFDVMNNDFSWAKLPCSFLNENTSFMLLTAIYANLYLFVIGRFSEKLSWLEKKFRLKKFIFRFITTPAKWIKTGRQYVLKLFTNKDYWPICC